MVSESGSVRDEVAGSVPDRNNEGVASVIVAFSVLVSLLEVKLLLELDELMVNVPSATDSVADRLTPVLAEVFRLSLGEDASLPERDAVEESDSNIVVVSRTILVDDKVTDVLSLGVSTKVLLAVLGSPVEETSTRSV